MISPEKPVATSPCGTDSLLTTWRLRIGRALLIFTGLWGLLWTAGYCYFVASSGTLGGDPVLAHWVAMPIHNDLHIGLVATNSPLATLTAITPSAKLLVLFDVAGAGVSAFYAPNATQKIVVIPAWTPLLILFGLACLFLARRREPVPNTCASCGYNLTGNVSGRCPECGQQVQQRDPASR